MHKVPLVTCILLHCIKWSYITNFTEGHSATVPRRQVWTVLGSELLSLTVCRSYKVLKSLQVLQGSSYPFDLHSLSEVGCTGRNLFTIWRSWMPLVSPGRVAWVVGHAAQGRCTAVSVWWKVSVTWHMYVPWEVHLWSQRAAGRYMCMSARSRLRMLHGVTCVCSARTLGVTWC